MSSIKFNKSKTYLLPLLSEAIDLNSKFLPYLNNTFMMDEHDTYNDCLYILHDFNFADKEFTSYEHHLMSNELFVESYDINDKVLYVFKFPKKYLSEYNYFKCSQYSKFDNEAKEIILNYWGIIYKNNHNAIKVLKQLKGILFKEKSYKLELEKAIGEIIPDNNELGQFVNLNDETFNLINLKHNEYNY